MKKYFLLSLFLAGFTSASNDAWALATLNNCAQHGFSAGKTCTTTRKPDGGQIFSACTDPGSINCVYKDCPTTLDGCACVTIGGDCPTIGGGGQLAQSCSDTPSWSSVILAGKQSGTCTDKSSGSTVKVYRCVDGYYTSDISITGYSFDNITCTACPPHPEDPGTYASNKPSYVTTGGVGMYRKNACKIKANTDIPDSTGKFQYSSECKYNALTDTNT